MIANLAILVSDRDFKVNVEGHRLIRALSLYFMFDRSRQGFLGGGGGDKKKKTQKSLFSVGLIEAKILNYNFLSFFFLTELIRVHRLIRHSRNQLTVALLPYKQGT